MIRKLSALALGMLFAGCVLAEDAVSQALNRYATSFTLAKQQTEMNSVTAQKNDPAMKHLKSAQQKLLAGAIDDIKGVIKDQYTAFRDLDKVYGAKGWSEAFKKRMNVAIADMKNYATKLQQRATKIREEYVDPAAVSLRDQVLQSVSNWSRMAQSTEKELRGLLKDAEAAGKSEELLKLDAKRLALVDALNKDVSALTKIPRNETPETFAKLVMTDHRNLQDHVDYQENKLSSAQKQMVDALPRAVNNAARVYAHLNEIQGMFNSPRNRWVKDFPVTKEHIDWWRNALVRSVNQWKVDKNVLQKVITNLQPALVAPKASLKQYGPTIKQDFSGLITLLDAAAKAGEKALKDLDALRKYAV